MNPHPQQGPYPAAHADKTDRLHPTQPPEPFCALEARILELEARNRELILALVELTSR